MQSFIGLLLVVPGILGGSLKTPGPLNSKKSLDLIGLRCHQPMLISGYGIEFSLTPL